MTGKAFKFVRIKEQEVLMVRDELCFPRKSTLYIALHTLFGELSTLRISSRTGQLRKVQYLLLYIPYNEELVVRGSNVSR